MFQMLIQSDWSQFIPTIIDGIILLAVEWLFSSSFRRHSEIQTGSNRLARRWLWRLWLVAIFSLVIVTIVGVSTDMTTKQITITVGYFGLGLSVLVAFYFGFIWPCIRVSNISEIPASTATLPSPIDPTSIAPTSSPDVVPELTLTFSGGQIHVTASGDIILKTVISSIAENNRKPINILLPENFSIVETFKNDLKRANIYSVTPSSTSADIIVLIDTSGSMSEPTDMLNKNGEPLTKLEVVKEAINLFFNELSNSKLSTTDRQASRIAFLPFSGQGINFLKSDDGDIWFSVQPETRSEVSKALKKLTPGGATPLYSAIAHALTIIEDTGDERYKLLFCLTDGLDTHSLIYFEPLIDKLQNHTIPVITVGYGQDGKYNGDVLRDIALNSGAGQAGVGSFINVSPKNLSGVFTKLTTDLNNIYEIHWKSTFPKPGNKVTANITVRFQLNNGSIITATEIRTYTIPP